MQIYSDKQESQTDSNVIYSISQLKKQLLFYGTPHAGET